VPHFPCPFRATRSGFAVADSSAPTSSLVPPLKSNRT
jgi:hypothetical protein